MPVTISTNTEKEPRLKKQISNHKLFYDNIDIQMMLYIVIFIKYFFSTHLNNPAMAFVFLCCGSCHPCHNRTRTTIPPAIRTKHDLIHCFVASSYFRCHIGSDWIFIIIFIMIWQVLQCTHALCFPVQMFKSYHLNPSCKQLEYLCHMSQYCACWCSDCLSGQGMSRPIIYVMLCKLFLTLPGFRSLWCHNVVEWLVCLWGTLVCKSISFVDVLFCETFKGEFQGSICEWLLVR